MSMPTSSAALSVFVEGVGLLGPGLPDWEQGQVALRTGPWTPGEVLMPAPQRLPAAERRRAGAVVKLSIAVADQACTDAACDPSDLATVFSASSGDGANCHALCDVLASADRLVSPTRFTNSVHNAPAGYWHIATHSRAPSTSLCAHDASFSAGLLEAAVQVVSQGRRVLLVAADVPYPEPLHRARPLAAPFGVALVLAPARTPHSRARLLLALAGDAMPDGCGDAGLETLRGQVPAARGLPLLQALAHRTAVDLTLDHLPQRALAVSLWPV